jgi:hypothetical protein
MMTNTRSRLAAILGAWLLIACDTGDVDFQVTATVPSEIATVSSGVLRASLWVHDPMLADAPASLADADSVMFSHVAGTPSDFRFRLTADVPGRQQYYITIRGFELTPECEKYILWDGLEATAAPSRVVMRAVPAHSCQP